MEDRRDEKKSVRLLDVPGLWSQDGTEGADYDTRKIQHRPILRVEILFGADKPDHPREKKTISDFDSIVENQPDGYSSEDQQWNVEPNPKKERHRQADARE